MISPLCCAVLKSMQSNQKMADNVLNENCYKNIIDYAGTIAQKQ
jgi:hypothetical protein